MSLEMGGILLRTTNVFNKTYTSIWSVSWLSAAQWHAFSSLSASLAHLFLFSLSVSITINSFFFSFSPHLGPRSHVLHCLTKNSCGKVKHPEKFSYEKSIKKILRWCISFSFSTSLSVAVSSLILTLTFRWPAVNHTRHYRVCFWMDGAKLEKKKKK